MRAYLLGLLGGLTAIVLVMALAGVVAYRLTRPVDPRTQLLRDLAAYAQEYPHCRRLVSPAAGTWESIDAFRGQHPAFDNYWRWLHSPAERQGDPVLNDTFIEMGCPQILQQQDVLNKYFRWYTGTP